MASVHTYKPAFIGLGSNVGNREQYLNQAVRLIGSHPLIRVEARSGIYETEPVGYKEQDLFLNMVIHITTGLSSGGLMEVLLQIERQLGRIRQQRWGPRTIDLDILWYNNENCDNELVTLPHPRMWERNFVLIPLAELVGEQPVPGLESIRSHMEKLDGKEGVRLWKTNNWLNESEHSEN